MAQGEEGNRGCRQFVTLTCCLCHFFLCRGQDSTHSFPAPTWGPSHRRQSSVNFSKVNCSHKLQFCTNCFSGGLFHGVSHSETGCSCVGPFPSFYGVSPSGTAPAGVSSMGSLLQEQAAAPKNLHGADVLIQHNKIFWGGKTDQHACWKRGGIFPK